MGLTSDVSLGIAARDAASLPLAATVLPAGTTVNVGFIDLEGRSARVEAARALLRAGLTPVPHLSARRLTSQRDLEEFLVLLEQHAASSHVFVVGGDPIAPAGPYVSALDIIRSGELEQHGVRSVSFGGYPEGHPAIDDRMLWAALDEKAELLAEQERGGEIITQLTLDPEAALAWIARVRDRGIELPIRVGVAGPVSAGALLGLAHRFGARTADGVSERYGLEEAAPTAIATASRFVEALGSRLDPGRHGEVGLHVFSFAGLMTTSEWVAGLPAAAG
jgi:methylenetetrahydrofolate reductase (NADPH)